MRAGSPSHHPSTAITGLLLHIDKHRSVALIETTARSKRLTSGATYTVCTLRLNGLDNQHKVGPPCKAPDQARSLNGSIVPDRYYETRCGSLRRTVNRRVIHTAGRTIN